MLKHILLPIAIVGATFPAIAATSDVPITYAEKGLPFPVTKKGATINITTGKITDVAISDKSCVVYSQIQNSIYVKALSPCLRFDGVGVPDRNPTLRVWVDSKILEFNIRTGASGSRNINVVADRAPEPFRKPVDLSKTSILPIPSIPKVSRIEATPPPPQNDPTELIQQPVDVTPAQNLSGSVPLLKPIPQTFNLQEVKKAVKSTRKRKKRSPKITLPESQLIKDKPSIAEQDKLSPSERALSEISVTPSEKKKEIVKEVSKPLKSPAAKKAKWKKPVLTSRGSPSFKLALNQSQAKALLKGLNISRLKKGEGRIAYRSSSWMKIQDTIYFLKVGNSLDIAIRKSKASKGLVEKLLVIGGLGA